MGLGTQRSCCCGRRIDIYFCIAMADGVYLTIFLLGYVCEAPERRQIKSIYLHSAFLQALDFLNLRGPGSRDWGRWEKDVAGVGGQESPGGGNSTSFNHRNEVAPAVSGAITRLPKWIHTLRRALLPPCSVSHRRRPGWSEAARHAKVSAGRTERTFLGAVDLSGRPGQGHRPSFTAEDPTLSAPLQGGGWAAGDLGGDIWVVGPDRVPRVPRADSAPCRVPLHCPKQKSAISVLRCLSPASLPLFRALQEGGACL